MRRRLIALAALVGLPTAAAHQARQAAPTADFLWTISAAASAVMAVTFTAIAWFLWRAIVREDQLTSNPLLTGIALIFTTCAIGHLLHLEHTILPLYAPEVFPALGLGDVSHAISFGLWARAAMADPILLFIDVATAAVGVGYLALRRRYNALFEGAELTEDIHEREHEARILQDEIVQRIAEAKLLVEHGEHTQAREIVDATLEESRDIVEMFLDEDQIEPGRLRRVDAEGESIGRA